jgi:hypothetical protein
MIRILKRRPNQLLIVIEGRIYWLTIRGDPRFKRWIPTRVYLLEAIPSKPELVARIESLISKDKYHDLSPDQTRSVVKNLIFFLSLMITQPKLMKSVSVPNIDSVSVSSPDTILLYRDLRSNRII